MIIVKYVKDFERDPTKHGHSVGYWIEGKKGDYHCMSDFHFEYFSRIAKGCFEFVGRVNLNAGNQVKSITKFKELSAYIALQELKKSADLEELRSVMKNLNIKRLGV